MTRTVPSLAVIGLLLVSILGAAGSVGATHDASIYSHQPEHVTVSYDEDALAKYQPHLATAHLEVQPEAHYAAIFSSPDWETDAYCYWSRYSVQKGVFGSADSHVGDREPICVFVTGSGDIDRITYSAYHWYAATLTEFPTVTDANGNERPTLKIAKPHHHHYLHSHGRDAGESLDLKPLIDTSSPGDSAAQVWYDNGWDSIDLGVFFEPWTVDAEGSWWNENTREGKIDARKYGFYLWLSEWTGLDFSGSQLSDLV